jgi:hypothetical protein
LRQCAVVLFGLSSLLVTAPAGKAGPILYAGVGNSGSSSTGAADGDLVILNQTNAAATLVGQPANVGITGLAFNSLGELWGSAAANRTGATPFLEHINRLTGAQIGSVALTASGPLVIGDLSFQPGTDVLFGISTGGFLFTINTATGVATLVGDTGTGRTGGLAFAPNGTLYLAGAPSDLYTLSPTTGAVLSIVAVTDANTQTSFFMDGLGIRPTDGVLFANQAAVNAVYTIDPATGFVTSVGSVSTGKVSDLAFFDTPEAGSWALMSAGLLTLAGLRRPRRSK